VCMCVCVCVCGGGGTETCIIMNSPSQRTGLERWWILVSVEKRHFLMKMLSLQSRQLPVVWIPVSVHV
jgi:hypothetical protein